MTSSASMSIKIFQSTTCRLLNNYVSCEGDATEIHSARGCDTDEFVDWDAGRLLMIRDVRVMGNVQKCDGDGTVNQTGCDTDDTFETTSSSDSLDITDLHIINNLQVCSGDQCENQSFTGIRCNLRDRDPDSGG